ncbi:putative gustatory receptor 98b [Calliphora vicina]|uniref:putative gustatory receptor 98b n=1 Tax=Calliphora vicina TaxID=7373 RepID=UPI00325B85CF
MGINLPPLLNHYQDDGNKKLIQFVWFCFAIYTTLLVALVIWIVYINNIVVDFVVFSNDLDSITSVLSISVNITVAFVQVIIQMVSIIKHKCLKMMLKRIAQLEQDILLYFREYQLFQDDAGYLNFQRSRKRFTYLIVVYFGVFSLAFGILLCYVNYHLVANIMDLRDKALSLFCTLALQLKTVEYCIIVQIIDEFLRSLQGSLRHLKWEIAKSQDKPFMGAFFHGKLMANQFLLNRIWFLVTNMEDYFAIPMLSLFLYNGIAITHTINWSYVRSFDYLYNDMDSGMYRLYYIILIFLIMLLPCWLTQSCIDKYNQFGSILHNIKTIDDLAINCRVREYSLQLMHQEMLFTCSGFFDINLKCFGLMILSISTYVAILIQFKLQNETEKANVRL